MVGQAKWDAWNEFKGMPQKNAGLAYIFIVENFLPGRKEGAGDGMGSGTTTHTTIRLFHYCTVSMCVFFELHRPSAYTL